MKIKTSAIVYGIRYIRRFGLRTLIIRIIEKKREKDSEYQSFYLETKASLEQLEKQRMEVSHWNKKEKISIVTPLYHTPAIFLRELIESVLESSYENWQLCFADATQDGEENQIENIVKEYQKMDEKLTGKKSRICYKKLSQNYGIAENTNQALAMAEGDYIAFLDHDDIITPDALYEMALAAKCAKKTGKEANMFYSDEDKVNENRTAFFEPHFKPDFNVDLLRSNNYITHFFVVRTSLIRQVGGFRREYDGAQDYDFIFRCTEAAKKICHIPEVLYYWRTHQASTADNPASKMYAFDAGKRAIEAHLKRQGVEGTVSHTKDLGFYQVEYPVQGNPLVSVLIPNKDQKDTLKQCLDSVFSKTTYCNYEVIIIENNSQEKETWEYYEELKKRDNVKIVIWESGFNYSAINNFGEKSASGEYLLFLNNDVEVINPHWMEEMLGNCQRKEVGIVGAKLYYPDDTIQHAGTIIGIGGIAGHAFLNMPRSRSGYLHKASLQMDLSAVTAACMMMKRTVFESLDGFEEALTVAFNDVDLCLRCVRAGYLVVYNPRVELYHYESKSRGSEDSEDKVRRFQQEIEFMRTRWIDLLKQGDPYYNKNLTLSKWNYSLRA